ncbi:MAG: hypothetical protein AB7V27_04560 [Candidatus Binatia bacterium]
MVSYAAAIPQNGCPFCCAFHCMLTPTPTPHIELGREVFVHTQGQFRIVIEARRGTSQIDPGIEILPGDDDRGDLQILLSAPIGDPTDPIGFGSAAVCDKGPVDFGGVPGVDPPEFGPSQQVTDAIHDLQCRFSVHTQSDVACTRRRDGTDGFLGDNTRRQFCFLSTITTEFQPGDTVVAVQLRDLGGNLGPKKEFVIRVLP